MMSEMRSMSKDEVRQFFEEAHEMLATGTAEIIYASEELMLVCRADRSGFIVAKNPLLIANISYISTGDEESLDGFQKALDRQPSDEANDLLRQVFDDESED